MMKVNEFIAIGEKEKVKNIKRVMDYYNKFNTDKIDYQYFYDELPSSLQRIVDETVLALSDNADIVHQGYNLHQITKYYYECSEKVQLRYVLNEIREKAKRHPNDRYSNFILESKPVKEKNDGAISGDTSMLRLKKTIERAYATVSFRNHGNKSALIEDICSFWMIDFSIVEEGEGLIFIVNPKVYDSSDYKEFSEAVGLMNKGIGSDKAKHELMNQNPSQERKLKLEKLIPCMKTIEKIGFSNEDTYEYFELYQNYLKQKYPDDAERINIIEEKYAKLMKRCEYTLLKGKELQCVNNLIVQLWKHEDTLVDDTLVEQLYEEV